MSCCTISISLTAVAVSPDQSFVLVNDTGAYRVRRYWLTGRESRSVRHLHRQSAGLFRTASLQMAATFFWLSLVNRRDAALDAFANLIRF